MNKVSAFPTFNWKYVSIIWQRNLDVIPICLPRPDFQASVAGDTVTVIGFGRTQENTQSYSLLEVNLPIVSSYRCAAVYPNRTIDDSQLCAGGIPKEDTCDGSCF